MGLAVPPKNPPGQTAPENCGTGWPSCVSTGMQLAVGGPSVNAVQTLPAESALLMQSWAFAASAERRRTARIDFMASSHVEGHAISIRRRFGNYKRKIHVSPFDPRSVPLFSMLNTLCHHAAIEDQQHWRPFSPDRELLPVDRYRAPATPCSDSSSPGTWT